MSKLFDNVQIMVIYLVFLCEKFCGTYFTNAPRTFSPKGIVQFWSCNKAVASAFPHKAEPSSATGQYIVQFWSRSKEVYLLDCWYRYRIELIHLNVFGHLRATQQVRLQRP